MLTTSPHLPPEGVGDCVMTQHFDPDTGERSVTIDQADPRILISGELLYRVATAVATPDFRTWYASLTGPDDGITHCGGCSNPNHDWTGAILRIQGSNRMVVYRITGRADVPGGWRDPTWIGEWPD